MVCRILLLIYHVLYTSYYIPYTVYNILCTTYYIHHILFMWSSGALAERRTQAGWDAVCQLAGPRGDPPSTRCTTEAPLASLLARARCPHGIDDPIPNIPKETTSWVLDPPTYLYSGPSGLY